MKIKYAITSCNDNSDYYQFWPLLSRVWKEFLDIDPILIYIGEDLPIELQDNKYGQIIIQRPFDGIPSSTQSQFIRLWYTKNYPDDIVITTDIDMFPLSRWYFKDQIRNLDDDKFIHLAEKNPPGYNICYNVAKGSIFNELLGLDGSFDTILSEVYYRMKSGGHNTWFVDEYFISEKLDNYNGDKFKRITRKSYNRINRNNWDYNPALVKLGMYYDYHSARPYKQYKEHIDKLINCVF